MNGNAATTFPLHEQATGALPIPPAEAFAWLDEHRNLASHMESRSPWMAGSRFQLEIDAAGGKAVGSRIALHGRVLGIELGLEEIVVRREPPFCKQWQTQGMPRLLVVGPYRMGFGIEAGERGTSLLTVHIDYALPSHGLARWLGRLLGPRYARWCTRRMLRDAQSHALDRARGLTLP